MGPQDKVLSKMADILQQVRAARLLVLFWLGCVGFVLQAGVVVGLGGGLVVARAGFVMGVGLRGLKGGGCLVEEGRTDESHHHVLTNHTFTTKQHNPPSQPTITPHYQAENRRGSKWDSVTGRGDKVAPKAYGALEGGASASDNEDSIELMVG